MKSASKSQRDEFVKQAGAIISACKCSIEDDPNPLKAITRLHNRLTGLAVAIFPQVRGTYSHPRKPGWNKYVRQAQANLELALTLWHLAGRSRDGPLALDVIRAKQQRKLAIDRMEQNVRRSVAEAMGVSFTESSTQNRSLCWKPVSGSIKGNAQACSPVIESLTRGKEQTEFWYEHYKGKLNGTTGSIPENVRDPELVKLSNTPSETVKFPASAVVDAISNLNKDCAYYDQFSPRLLALVNTSFAEVFAIALNKFVNTTLDGQIMNLQDPVNFLISYIKPILKAADVNPTIAKSYRPISVSHSLTMLTERTLRSSKNPFKLVTVTPRNFYGYIEGRSCDIAVETLKDILLADKKKLKGSILVTLDASGAFEGVEWNKIFPRLAKKNNPRVVRLIWLMYAFNRYEVRWKNFRAVFVFCATKGTKQGGVLSGYVFIEYMYFLDEKLQESYGFEKYDVTWNALFYADDVLLLCKNELHAQALLNICADFQQAGFIQWNADKTKVLHLQDSNYDLGDVPKKSPLKLNDKNLDRVVCIRWLGYMLNHFLSDDDMILRQAQRLYAIGNNLKRSLPLELVEDHMLRQIACAYGGVYLLPVLHNSTKVVFQRLRAAHRHFVMLITQYKERSPNWDVTNRNFEASNRSVYGRLNVKTLDNMRLDQTDKFVHRFCDYVRTFSPDGAASKLEVYKLSEGYSEFREREKQRIELEQQKIRDIVLANAHADLFIATYGCLDPGNSSQTREEVERMERDEELAYFEEFFNVDEGSYNVV